MSRESTYPTTRDDFQAIADKLPRLVIDGRKTEIVERVGPSKTAEEMSACKNVSAWALLHVPAGAHEGMPYAPGSFAGRIVWVIGSGGAWTCTISAWSGPLGPMPAMTGRAGGYGYCKRSASFSDALRRAGVTMHGVSGAGEGQIRAWLRDRNYLTAELI